MPRSMSSFMCYTQEDAANAAKSMVGLSIPFTVTPFPCDEWEVSYPTEHEHIVRYQIAEAV